MATQPSAFLLYLPVIQQGYLDFFDQHPTVKVCFVLSDHIKKDIPHLRKDIRALAAEEAANLLRATKRFSTVTVIEPTDVANICSQYSKLIMPDDDVTEYLVNTDELKADITKVRVFLRWHRENVKKEANVEVDATVTMDDVPAKIHETMTAQGKESTDWWRRIGAVLAADGEIKLASYNKHLPTQYTPYIDGDMRMSLNRGDGIELVGTEHAEAALLASAASQGIKTKGLDLYVSTFPCPPCAKFIAHAGVANVYFEEGYAMGNGQEVLKMFGVRIIRILDPPKRKAMSDERPYPEK